MKRIVPSICAIALASCSAEPATIGAEQEAAGAKSAEEMEALSLQDMETVNLAGELSCSFTERGEGGTYLVAAADVVDDARADGVMKIGADIVPLRGMDTGGFNAMVRGGRFGGEALEAIVTVTSDTPLDDSESPPLAAALTLIREGREGEKVPGEWTCGP